MRLSRISGGGKVVLLWKGIAKRGASGNRTPVRVIRQQMSIVSDAAHNAICRRGRHIAGLDPFGIKNKRTTT